MHQPQHIPTEPGIYIFRNRSGKILYIGKAKNLKKRVSQYFAQGSVWKQDMIHNAHDIEYITVRNEHEALLLEENLIKKHQPEYNRLLKENTSYVYIKITNHAFPQIFLTRKKRDDGATYLGPKHNAKHLKQLLQYFRQLLQYRGCKDTEFRKGILCSDYMFGLCKGRCVFARLHETTRTHDKTKAKNRELIDNATKLGLSIDKGYRAYANEYQRLIDIIVRFFSGDSDHIQTDIKARIDDAITTQNFEYAAQLRDIYAHIGDRTSRQHVITDTSISGHLCRIERTPTVIVFCLLTFHQGKIVNIIREKTGTDETDDIQLRLGLSMLIDDIDTIWTSVDTQGQGGNLATEEEKKKNTATTQRLTTIPNLPRRTDTAQASETQIEVTDLTERFIESYIIAGSFGSNSIMSDLLAYLQNHYGLTHYPYHMECLDISHMQGDWTSGGLSCFHGGVKHQSGYRRYRITADDITPGDDYQAISFVIRKKFGKRKPENQKNEGSPDLFIIDGGLLHLRLIPDLIASGSLHSEITSHIQFVALGKGDARHTGYRQQGINEQLFVLHPSNHTITTHDLTYDQSDHLLVKIRDEAHRFANTYRKKQMSSEWKR